MNNVTPLKRMPMKRGRGFTNKRKAINPLGKQGRKNAAANRKIAVKRAGQTRFCAICGSTFDPHNSHDAKRRFLNDEQLLEVIDLCDFPCHEWMDNVLDRSEQLAVNSFLRESLGSDPEWIGEQIAKMIPAKFEQLLEKLGLKQSHAPPGA